MDIIRAAISDFAHGLFDSIHGFLFLRELDKDDEYVAVNATPQRPVRTALQMRREAQGQYVRPAEPILRHRERVWRRILMCIGTNIFLISLLWVCTQIIGLVIKLFSNSGEKTDEERHRYAEAISISLFFLAYVFLIKIVMALWFSDIAGACHRCLRLQEPPPLPFQTMLAEILYSCLLYTMFSLQACLVSFLPLPQLSELISFVHYTLFNSIYCFDYFWFHRNIPLKTRVSLIESHLPYFIGFGTPLTLATYFTGSSFVVNGCIYASLFPFFIISSYKADWRSSNTDSLVPPIHIFTPSRLLSEKIAFHLTKFIVNRPTANEQLHRE